MRRFLLAAVALLATRSALAQQSTTENDRLLATGKLWVTLKYFHPYLAYRPIDWDKALVDALPGIRAATTSAEYATAVQSMLDALHDPSTYVLRGPAKQNTSSLNFETRPDGTLVASESNTSSASPHPVPDLLAAITSAHNIVFDLRGGESLSSLLDAPEVQAALAAVPPEIPGQRTWVHNGLESNPAVSCFYYSAFQVKQGAPVAANPAAKAHRLVFVLGENSRLPAVAFALLASGSATVISESPHYRIAGAETVTLDLGQSVSAIVRLSEPILPDGTALPPIPTASHDHGIPQALARLSQKSQTPSQKGQTPPRSFLPPYPSPQPDRAYAETRYPSTEYRILAACKIWGVFHYYFAYRDLMDEDWDDLLPVFLPKFIAAKDAREYNLTVAEMITHVADSHASVQSEELSDYFGRAPVGLRLRLLDKKPVIVEILDDQAKKAGVQVGDIVTAVDGENMARRINGQAHYIASSTRQWLGYRVMQRVLNGPEGSIAALTIEGQDGDTKQVTLKRSTSYSAALRTQRTGDIVKLLAGNIGYVDLDRLAPGQVDSMFEKFRDTKAIVFDMRGYPHGTAWPIAPRLTDRQDVPAAIVTGPLSLTPDVPRGKALTSNASYFFVQRLPAASGWIYKGKTVMLIDERTMSQAEHTGLFLEAANKTEFIGTPSAGADGDVSSFVVPGGIVIGFSGHDIRLANGGKLQRVGLQPAVTVQPTIDGIRSGHDEVLEKAIEYLSK